MAIDDELYQEHLYLEHRARVYRIVRGIVLDATAAEDLTWRAFERTFSSGEGDPAELLYRVAVSEAVAHARRQRLLRLVPRPRQCQPAGRPRTLATMALQALAPRRRAVVVLRCYMTTGEAAAVMGLTARAVDDHLAAAAAVMRERCGGAAPIRTRWSPPAGDVAEHPCAPGAGAGVHDPSGR
jgi:DNA-directed RNA polymerase specialized sigma24 family protein